MFLRTRKSDTNSPWTHRDAAPWAGERVPLPAPKRAKLIVAHRGLTLGGPRENTLEAFERAIERGADMIEFDVRRTRDGVLVVNHDPRVRGRSVSGLTYAELKAWEHGRHVPKLEEVLRLAVGRVMVYVELKEAGYERKILNLVRQYFRPDHFVMASFEDAVVKRLKELAPDVCVGLGVGGTHHYQLLTTKLTDLYPMRRLARAHADFLSYSYTLDYFGVSKRAAAAGVPVVVWRVNRRWWLKWYLANQRNPVVITDIPDVVLREFC